MPFFSPLAATQSGDTLSSLSTLQQKALYIPQSALSGLEPIGEGTHALIFTLLQFNVLGSRHTRYYPS